MHPRDQPQDAFAVSETLTRTVLGLDALYRHEHAGGEGKLDQEGLVPVHWSALEPSPVTSWAEAQDALGRIVRRASLLADPWARDWLAEFALSVLTLARWLGGEPLAYEQVVAGALRVDPAPPSGAQLERCRQARDEALRVAGHAGYPAYLEAHRVAPADVAAVMTELVEQAEERTRRRLPALRLPAERIGVEAVSGTPFSAYCDYPGRMVWINTDVPHTRAGLKQLVAHEAYPGHYAHMGHRDALVRAGETLPDAALVVTNTASSALFEGIAERGLDLLGWRDAPEDQVDWLHNRLQWLASIEAAHALNTERAGAAEVADFLRRSCDADEAWIDGKIRFVTHPLRAPFVYGYWWGGTVVGRWWRRVDAVSASRAVRYLYDRMHSPTTLAAHWTEEDTDEHSDSVSDSVSGRASDAHA